MRRTVKVLYSLFALLLLGCTSHKGFTTENLVSSSRHERLSRDSVYVRDSVFLREKADTVFYTKYRTFYKEKILRDTVIKCDTVFCEKVITLEKDDGGGFCWWLVVPVLAILWRLGVFKSLFSRDKE